MKYQILMGLQIFVACVVLMEVLEVWYFPLRAIVDIIYVDQLNNQVLIAVYQCEC